MHTYAYADRDTDHGILSNPNNRIQWTDSSTCETLAKHAPAERPKSTLSVRKLRYIDWYFAPRPAA